MKPLAKPALALSACALALLIAEVVLRLTLYRFSAYPRSPGPGAAYPIETLEFKTMARTNSLNIRDSEIAPKAPGEFRVLCLGDSFTFGLGVDAEQAYPQILQKLLGPKTRVINGGTGAAAPEALAFLKTTGLGLKPDAVIAQVYIGNDFYDVLPSLETPRSEAAPRLYTADLFWNFLIRFPLIDSLLYRLNLRYGNRGIYLKNYPPLEQGLVESELAALREINRLAKKHGARLFMLIVPDKQQLFMRDLLDAEKYDLRKPNRLLAEFGRRENIPVIDLARAYDALPPREVRSFYYSRDLHWTAKGSLHAATLLAGRLSR